jgi:hypothetical protein
VISSNAISVITTMGIFAPAVTEERTGILASRGFTNIRWRFSAESGFYPPIVIATAMG